MFLAVWHGYHLGYFVLFFMEFVIILWERKASDEERGWETGEGESAVTRMWEEGREVYGLCDVATVGGADCCF